MQPVNTFETFEGHFFVKASHGNLSDLCSKWLNLKCLHLRAQRHRYFYISVYLPCIQGWKSIFSPYFFSMWSFSIPTEQTIPSLLAKNLLALFGDFQEWDIWNIFNDFLCNAFNFSVIFRTALGRSFEIMTSIWVIVHLRRVKQSIDHVNLSEKPQSEIFVKSILRHMVCIQSIPWTLFISL